MMPENECLCILVLFPLPRPNSYLIRITKRRFSRINLETISEDEHQLPRMLRDRRFICRIKKTPTARSNTATLLALEDRKNRCGPLPKGHTHRPGVVHAFSRLSFEKTRFCTEWMYCDSSPYSKGFSRDPPLGTGEPLLDKLTFTRGGSAWLLVASSGSVSFCSHNCLWRWLISSRVEWDSLLLDHSRPKSAPTENP
jgi:hypothetical protein